MPDLATLDISAWGWVALALGALLGGFSKTAIAGVITIPIALFAAVLPARESTGTLLVLLICGDLVAIWIYRRSVAWAMLARMIPPVLVGIVAGAWFLDHVDDAVMRRTIGAILIVLSAIQIGRMVIARRAAPERHAAPKLSVSSKPSAAPEPSAAPAPTAPAIPLPSPTTLPSEPDGAASLAGAPTAAPPDSDSRDAPRGLRRLISLGYGLIAGFTTMVANAGGPVMSLYLLSQRFSMLHFLGTTAWFFFGVNLIKLPFSIGLGLVSFDSLHLDLVLVPLIFVGCALGRWCIKRINQTTFEWLILAFTVISSLYLLR